MKSGLPFGVHQYSVSTKLDRKARSAAPYVCSGYISLWDVERCGCVSGVGGPLRRTSPNAGFTTSTCGYDLFRLAHAFVGLAYLYRTNLLRIATVQRVGQIVSHTTIEWKRSSTSVHAKSDLTAASSWPERVHSSDDTLTLNSCCEARLFSPVCIG